MSFVKRDPLLQNINFFSGTRRCMNQVSIQNGRMKRYRRLGKKYSEMSPHVVQERARICFKMAGIALQIAALSVKVFLVCSRELITQPFKTEQLNQKVKRQIRSDLALLKQNPGKREFLHRRIDRFIREEGLLIPEEHREKYIKCAMATYASSQAYYGPVAMGWARSVLDTAALQDRKLVFLARDGIAPYHLALKMKEEHPDLYGDVEISLAYLSRNVIDNADVDRQNPEILSDYMQQLGINEGDKCLFVDVGFKGSRNRSVKDQLQNLNLDIEHHYLISLTQDAYGFMLNLDTNLDNELKSVYSAEQNLAVHWLEDTHQGVEESPKRLIKKDGRVVPDTFENEDHPKTCKEKNTLTYLLKFWGAKAIEESMEEDSISSLPLESWYAKCRVCRKSTKDDRVHSVVDPEQLQPWKMAKQVTKEKFDRFLSQVRDGERLIFVKHY